LNSCAVRYKNTYCIENGSHFFPLCPAPVIGIALCHPQQPVPGIAQLFFADPGASFGLPEHGGFLEQHHQGDLVLVVIEDGLAFFFTFKTGDAPLPVKYGSQASTASADAGKGGLAGCGTGFDHAEFMPPLQGGNHLQVLLDIDIVPWKRHVLTSFLSILACSKLLPFSFQLLITWKRADKGVECGHIYGTGIPKFIHFKIDRKAFNVNALIL